MTPVKQTRFNGRKGSGNCFEACVASLLHCRIKDVPDLRKSPTIDGKLSVLNKWLAVKGLEYVELDPAPPDSFFKDKDFHYILIGPVAGFPKTGPNSFYHSVIAWKGKVAFDPFFDPGKTRLVNDPNYLRVGMIVKRCR